MLVSERALNERRETSKAEKEDGKEEKTKRKKKRRKETRRKETEECSEHGAQRRTDGGARLLTLCRKGQMPSMLSVAVKRL